MELPPDPDVVDDLVAAGGGEVTAEDSSRLVAVVGPPQGNVLRVWDRAVVTEDGQGALVDRGGGDGEAVFTRVYEDRIRGSLG